MSESNEKFESWGLLELFGHQRLAGKLSEQTIGGCHFIRIDVPEVGETAAYTRFFTQGAIYGMTPMEDETARKLAPGRSRPPPRPAPCPSRPTSCAAWSRRGNSRTARPTTTMKTTTLIDTSEAQRLP